MPTSTPNSLDQAKAYDYNGPIDEKATPLAISIIEEMYNRRHELFVTDKVVKENPDAFDQLGQEFSIAIMKKVAESGIPYYFAAMSISKITPILDELKRHIDGTMSAYEQELIALTLGVKSPANGKYRKEDATVGDLIMKLDEARKAHDTDESDFVNDTSGDEKLADEKSE